MQGSLTSRSLHYAAALLSVGLAYLITSVIWPLVQPSATPLFLVAIVITAWRGGRGPGFVASILSGLVVDYVFIAPQYQLSGGWDDLSRLTVFAIEGFTLSWVIASRRQIGDQVRASREELRALSAHLQSMIEMERARIAREIHDELGRELTELKFDIAGVRDRAMKASNVAELAKLNATLKNVDTAIHSVRRIATELRPAVLDTLGLTAAIEWQAKDFQERTGTRCELGPMEEEIPLEREAATAIFRIFQETLTNIARHAGATLVRIKLERNDGHVLLRIADNGCGIDPAKVHGSGSLGLLGMQERVRLLNGEITIEGQAGKGTVLTVAIPLSAKVNNSSAEIRLGDN